MSIAYRIAQKWIDTSYPTVKCDQFAMPYYADYSTTMESLYNKLPLRAKKVLCTGVLHLCSKSTLKAITGSDAVLGFTKPGDGVIYYNLERFVSGEEPLSDQRFVTLFYHEIGHYLIHNFTDKDKEFYFKKFGTEPVTSGEPEADGFSAYMCGVAPYHVQEFWSWWALNAV